MSDAPPVRAPFDAAHAEIYDSQFEALRALKDAMHLLLRVHLSTLPPDARILVAGAGTGAEVRFLAPLFPGWRFTLVDPSRPMLDVARRHAEAEGLTERCTFHHGFVSSLPEQAHDAATSVLVSQFLTDAKDRQAYFNDIAARLKPGAPFFNADLATDRDSASFEALMDLWLGTLERAGVMPEERRAQYRGGFGQDFAAHGPAEVEEFITRAGFCVPTLCYQAVLIRAWVTHLAR